MFKKPSLVSIQMNCFLIFTKNTKKYKKNIKRYYISCFYILLFKQYSKRSKLISFAKE